MAGKTRTTGEPSDRAERLGAALRANLTRRKARSRAAKDGNAPGTAATGSADPAPPRDNDEADGHG